MGNELYKPEETNLPATEVALYEDPIAACVATMDLGDKEKRNLAFMLYVIACNISPTAAAGKIGLHPNSGPRLWKELNDVKSGRGLMQKFIQKVQDNFRVKTALKLDRVSTVEDKVLDMLEAQPEMAAKFPALLRQIKTVAGVLTDPQPISPVINIGQVANLMLNVTSEGK
jgi:hypothetical protein